MVVCRRSQVSFFWICIFGARWVERAFKRWRWSYKNAKYKSPLKYAAANLRYYVHYVTGIVRYPLDRLKFLDEARFDAKSLQREKGVSRVHRQNGAALWLSVCSALPPPSSGWVSVLRPVLERFL